MLKEMFGYLSPLLSGFLSPMYFADDDSGGDGASETSSHEELPSSGGTPSSTWIDSLPDDLKADPNVSKYKTPEEFVKGHINVVKMVGAKGIIVPKPDAPQEDQDKFYNALGRPEKSDNYKLTPIENKNISITPESEKMYKDIAHKAGLTNKQADMVQQEYAKMMGITIEQNIKEHDQVKKESETKLRQEWGAEYQKNITLAKRFVEKVGGKEVVDAFGDLGSNVSVLKFLANAGKMMSEDSISRLGVSSLETTAADAQRKIDSVRGNKSHPYYNENDPQHDSSVKEMRELYKIAHGGV